MTPEEGRRLWDDILNGAGQDEPIESQVLHHLIEGYMIDVINNQMARSDTFAITNGKRITTLVNAITGAPSKGGTA